MYYNLIPNLGLNLESGRFETGIYLSRDEKKAFRRADQAEEAFRASKGYAPKSFWKRLALRFSAK